MNRVKCCGGDLFGACAVILNKTKTAVLTCAAILNKTLEQVIPAEMSCSALVRVLHRCGGVLCGLVRDFFRWIFFYMQYSRYLGT